MSEIVYSEGFIAEAKNVHSVRKRKELRGNIELLSDFPNLGSQNLSDYIRREYGDHVRRLTVNPFLVIYEHDDEADEIHVLGLVHQRAAW